MKLKKILALILAIGSLATLTACNMELPGEYEYIGRKLYGSLETAKELINDQTNNKNTLNKVGFVTEDEFKAAIDKAISATNSTARAEYNYNFSDRQISAQYIQYVLHADTCAHYYGENEDGEYDYYFTTAEDVDYQYSQIEGVWTKTEYDGNADYSNAEFSNLLNDLKAVYSSLTYNEEKTFFEAETLTLATGENAEEKQSVRTVTVKFVEKSFVSVSYATDLTDEEGNVIGTLGYSLSIVDFGKTVVTLP